MPDMGMGEVGNKTRLAALEMLETRTRQNMRLMMPSVDKMPELYPMVHAEDQYFAVKQCNVCNPPPKVYKCPLCDWSTTEHWKMKLHNDINPQWCQRRAAKKERAWSNRVSLDG